jgi:diguanylate cyclase (GGDEF)-like protein
MLAAVLFFSGVARSVVIVDMLQALLFVVLRFNLIYSSVTRDHFVRNHLFVGLLMALFLLVVALVACLGAASRGELKFLRTLSWFFGLRLIAFFLANQVSYAWLHKQYSSLWDVPGPTLLAAFSLYLIYSGNSQRVEPVEQAPPLSPSITVRSLMPAFLAVANLMLGLLVLRISATLAAIAVSTSLVGYVLRTVMLQGQAVKEKALLQSRNEQLEGLAVRDPLTGIGNRRSLAGTYGELRNAGGSGTVSLLLIDIDHFKQANDCHGHLYGDQVLVTLAKKLQELAGAVNGSHCARFGGDEFAVILLDVSPQKASSMAEELRVLFNAHAFGAGKANGSLSIGVASLSSATELPLETFISYADEALYRAKLLGRNRVEAQPAWEPGIDIHDATRRALLMGFQNS